jgi:transposase
MAKVEYAPDARVLVGIDISKHRHEVLIAAPSKSRRRRMTVLNTADDYRRLIAALMEYGLPVTVGFEPTGNYHRALMFALGAAGFDLNLVSSVALARTREALHNSGDKNDPKDAQVIATAGFRHRRLALNDLDDQRRLALGCPLIAKFCSL